MNDLHPDLQIKADEINRILRIRHETPVVRWSDSLPNLKTPTRDYPRVLKSAGILKQIEDKEHHD